MFGSICIKILLMLISLFPVVSFAFENAGLHKLNPFPLKEWVARTYFKYETVDISLRQSLSKSTSIQESHNYIEEEIGKRLDESTYFSFAVNYGESSLSSLRTGGDTLSKYQANGFFGPTFKLFSRRKWAQGEGDPVLDLFVSFSPKIDKRKVGGNGANNFNGRNIWKVQASRGAFYESWDFNLHFNYVFWGSGREKDLFYKKDRYFDEYSDVSVSFEAQHYLKEKFFLRAGIGLRLIGDQIFYLDNESTEIQQGTGSEMYVGFVRKMKNFTGLVKFSRFRNDYFIKVNEGNREGDYAMKLISFEFLREF